MKLQLTDLLKLLGNWFKSRFYTFGEINRRYSKPRIHTSRMVSFSLVLLRIYLVIMVVILLYKFITVMKG